MHKVVIVLVNYNSFEDTKLCLLSMRVTEGDLPFVVLVDNASLENRNLEELHEIYPKLKLILNKKNLGFGVANNIGINWLQNNIDFEYILLLNNDTTIESDTLRKLIEPFNIDPKIGITTGRIMYESKRDIVWYGGGFINYKLGFPKIDDINMIASNERAKLSKYVSFISGCTMMFSKDSIERLVGFDSNYFMYCEDLELCMRAEKMNIKLFYESESIIYHRVNGSSKSEDVSPTGVNPKNPNAFFLYKHIRTNQYYTMRKHLSLIQFLIFNVFFFLVIIKTIIKMALYKRFDVFKYTFQIFSNIIQNRTADV